MRKFLLTVLFLLLTCYGVLFSQNKTLGVGVSTPNPNAALHVESPTGNQGFIMPRLTTVQRVAMASILKDVDKGMMLYDTDLSTMFIWDGLSWESSSMFTIDDTKSPEHAINAMTMGSGSAGRFRIDNVATFSHALYAENNGDSTSAAVHGNHTGNGFGVFGKSAGTKYGSSAVYGEHVGTGDAAAAFRISNTANPYSALYGETNGSGPAVYGNQVGMGRAGQFQITNGANTNAAVRTYTAGLGYSGFFTINNALSTSPGLYSQTNGSGAAIYGENSGNGDGFAGLFQILAATNTYPAIQASSDGLGPGLRIMQSAGTGGGVDILMQNVASTAPGLRVEQQGQSDAITAITSGTGPGSAGRFEVTNPSSSAIALWTRHNGNGTAFLANHTGVTGNIAVFQDSSQNVARIDKNGMGIFNGGTQSSGADVAEMFEVEGEKNSYEPGDVLVISEDTDRTVEKSALPNSTKVAGVYATKPGVRLTERSLDENMDDLVPMGVIGVIPTKVCLENGAIKRGDLLVTSSRPGHAMKAVPANVNGVLIYPTGAVIGKALENFDNEDSGLIKVLVNVK